MLGPPGASRSTQEQGAGDRASAAEVQAGSSGRGMRVKCQVLIKDETDRGHMNAFQLPSTSSAGVGGQAGGGSHRRSAEYADIEEVGARSGERASSSQRSMGATAPSHTVSVTASIERGSRRGSVSATVSATVDSVLGRADITTNAGPSGESGASVPDVTLSSSDDSDIEVVNVETK